MTYPKQPMETHLDHRDPPMPYQRKGYNRTTRWKSTRRWGHAGELREDAYSNNSYATPTHSTRTRDGTLFRVLASLMKCPCWTIAFSSTLLTAATLLTACGHTPAYNVTASALDCTSLTTDAPGAPPSLVGLLPLTHGGITWLIESEARVSFSRYRERERQQPTAS